MKSKHSLVLLVGIGISIQVRTLQQLLTAPAERAKTFHRGSRVYDKREFGYTDEGAMCSI